MQDIDFSRATGSSEARKENYKRNLEGSIPDKSRSRSVCVLEWEAEASQTEHGD